MGWGKNEDLAQHLVLSKCSLLYGLHVSTSALIFSVPVSLFQVAEGG